MAWVIVKVKCVSKIATIEALLRALVFGACSFSKKNNNNRKMSVVVLLLLGYEPPHAIELAYKCNVLSGGEILPTSALPSKSSFPYRLPDRLPSLNICCSRLGDLNPQHSGDAICRTAFFVRKKFVCSGA